MSMRETTTYDNGQQNLKAKGYKIDLLFKARAHRNILPRNMPGLKLSSVGQNQEIISEHEIYWRQ
jgi:hypothetical protein